MTRIYVMATCPDCIQIKEQAKHDSNYELIDIGEHVKNLKEFLRLRDSHPAFEEVKRAGSIGIPCFVREDGSVSFSVDDFVIEEIPDGAMCSLDNRSGC